MVATIFAVYAGGEYKALGFKVVLACTYADMLCSTFIIIFVNGCQGS